ncbi:hypothetical protein RQP46_002116 [Phenoliferia psychrophenolica]
MLSRRRSHAVAIPCALLKPGVEMLKVSAKSARRPKSRRLWLEVPSTGKDQPRTEVGLGQRAMSNVRICWEKNWRGVGPTTQASVPLSSVRDVRFGSTGSPYRTALHLSPTVEPRWMTLIYVEPSSSPSPLSLLGAPPSGSSYKLVHFIAPTPEALELWRSVLGKVTEGRIAREGVVREDSGAEVEWEKEGAEEGKVVKAHEVHALCKRLGMGMGKEEIKAAFEATAHPLDHLDFAGFQKFVQLLKRRDDVDALFREVSGGSTAGLSLEDWIRFLRAVQQSTLDEATLRNLYSKYSDLETGTVLVEGFTQFLLSSDNAAMRDERDQDMTRPLSEYYISSSHNTYLVGNQLAGEATIEGYIRALQQGCRCVELDIWSGDDGSPVVTHGRTLTSKIPARDALAAIAQYAFLASAFPVVLSIEIHCDTVQQDRLAIILRETLGDRLLDRRVDGGEGEIEHLPSPNELRGKVLLKAKNLLSAAGPQAAVQSVEADPFVSSSASNDSSSDSDLRQRVIRVFRRGGSSSSSDSTLRSQSSSPSSILTTSSRSIAPNPHPHPIAPLRSPHSPPVPKPPMSASLAALLIYTTGVKARGFNKKEVYAPTDVISLGESTIVKMLRDDGARQDFVGHNRNHLVRAYPKGSRVTSTNFLPHDLWAVGVQAVAMNWQRFDVGMELNMAMFARAGRAGYVLKPELLRRKGGEKDKESLGRTANFSLKLEIISAQQLPRSRDASDADSSTLDPFVEVSLFVPGVATIIKGRSKVVSGNAFHPIFKSSFTLNFTTHPAPGMLDLVFLRLEVLDAKGNLKAAADEGKGDSVASYAMSLGGLLPGYRHVPLYDAMGDQHLFSSLFIKSRIEGPS